MNKLKTIIPGVLLMTAAANAQSLSFGKFTHFAGNDLQAGAKYRFHDVINGVDAIISIESLTDKATIRQIDDFSASNPTDFAAWRPIIGGISPKDRNGNVQEQRHQADFKVSFVAANSFRSVTLDRFGVSVFDTDGDDDNFSGSDGEDGDVLELAILGGKLTSAGSQLAVSDRGNGYTQVIAKDSRTNPGVTDAAPWLSKWQYDNTNDTNVMLGWQGTDFLQNEDNDRLYGVYFDGKTQVVPEPTSSALLSLGAVSLLLRRKRK